MNPPFNTPWGATQGHEDVAPGIIRVWTAGHGGLWLAPDKWQKVAKLFPTQERYAPDRWLEEDCDWALAALAWPELFSERDCYHAVRTMSGPGDYGAPARAWLETPAAAEVLAKAARYIPPTK